jgi:hypothetical protein
MRFCGLTKSLSLFEELPQTGDLFHVEIVSAGFLEETALRAYQEDKPVVSVGLDLANLSNEVNYSTPA